MPILWNVRAKELRVVVVARNMWRAATQVTSSLLRAVKPSRGASLRNFAALPVFANKASNRAVLRCWSATPLTKQAAPAFVARRTNHSENNNNNHNGSVVPARVQCKAPFFKGVAVVKGQFQTISLNDYKGISGSNFCFLTIDRKICGFVFLSFRFHVCLPYRNYCIQ